MPTMICNVSSANLYFEPSHKSELHSQLLYNDTIHVLDDVDTIWCKVNTNYNRECFCLRSQLSSASRSESCKLVKDTVFLPNAHVNILHIGTRVGDNAEYVEGIEDSLCSELSMNEALAILTRAFLQTPYLWGGFTQSGIDCSGLSKLLYRFLRIELPHQAALQSTFGATVHSLQNSSSGDLAFFTNQERQIVHVGILLSTESILHASESNGKVCIDKIDSKGIINKKGYLAAPLHSIKRILN